MFISSSIEKTGCNRRTVTKGKQMNKERKQIQAGVYTHCVNEGQV